MSQEPVRSVTPTVLTGLSEEDTLESLDADGRVLPRGYRVVITHEPSLIMHGRIGEMITVWCGKEMVTRHLRHI
jgi:hypothetical protein